MPNTPKGLTYPSDASPVAVPADIEELATDVDGLIVPNTGGTYTGSVSFTQSPSVPTPTSGLHAVNKTYADAINTDVTALETELGTNPSGTFSTVADRLNTHDHPASSTDNTVARYDGTTGKIQGSTVVVDDNGRLTTPTGASGGYGFVSGAIHLTGTGAPESVVSAPIGSTYLQTDATNDVKGWIRWIKATGTGNTGWIAGPEADTGWRIVLAWSGASWTSTPLGTPHSDWTSVGNGNLSIRRTGSLVHYRCYYNLHTPSSGSGQQLLPNLPASFTGFGSFNVGDASSATQLDPYLNRSGDTSWYGVWLPIDWSASLPIYAPWPTSLPGTAG